MDMYLAGSEINLADNKVKVLEEKNLDSILYQLIYSDNTPINFIANKSIVLFVSLNITDSKIVAFSLMFPNNIQRNIAFSFGLATPFFR